MIDLRLIRSDYESVRAALKRRHSDEALASLARAADLDGRLREITWERDRLRQRINEVSKQVATLRRQGDTAGAEALQAESRRIGDSERLLADEHDGVEQALRQELLVIPNLPHPEAPDGVGDADNPVVSGPFVPDSFGEPTAPEDGTAGVDGNGPRRCCG